MRLLLRTWSFNFRSPFVTARGAWSVREGVWALLEDDAAVYVGEAAPLAGFGDGGIAEVLEDLRDVTVALGTVDRPRDPGEVVQALDAVTGPWRSSFSRAALEGALAERAAAHAGVSLAHWLSPQAVAVVPVNGAPGALASGGLQKVKVGIRPWRDEVALLRARVVAHPDVRFRLDANGAWDLETALAVVDALADLPVEMLEEPLARALPESMARMVQASPVPLALDESLVNADLRTALCTPACCHAWVLKPAALGGIASAWTLARRAADAGLGVTVTTLVDGCVGRWQAAALAAAVEGAGWGTGAHGLATGAMVLDGVDDPIDSNGAWTLQAPFWSAEDLCAWSRPATVTP